MRTAACGGSAAAPAVSREAHGHHFSRGLRGGDGVGCGGKERGQDWSCSKDVRNRSDRDPVLAQVDQRRWQCWSLMRSVFFYISWKWEKLRRERGCTVLSRVMENPLFLVV